MKNYRPERLSSLFTEHLNKIIQRELEFDNAVVTILNITVSDKLEEAVVKVSVFPSEKGPAVLFALLKRQPYLQFLLHRVVEIRPMPRLRFQLETIPLVEEIEKKS